MRKSKSKLSLKSSLNTTKTLFYFSMWNLVVCIYGANRARKVCFSNTRKKSSICCSIFHISSIEFVFLFSKWLFKKWTIFIWFVEREIQNRPNYCHSKKHSIVSFRKLCYFWSDSHIFRLPTYVCKVKNAIWSVCVSMNTWE